MGEIHACENTGHLGTDPLSLSLSILSSLLPATAGAAWQPGVSDQSYGRFAEWPRTTAGVFQYYEEDLFKRVYPDGLERSSKEMAAATWKVGFGWARTTDALPSITEPGLGTATNDLSVETLNWIRKRFLVQRRFTNGQAVATGVSNSCGSKTRSIHARRSATTWLVRGRYGWWCTMYAANESRSWSMDLVLPGATA